MIPISEAIPPTMGRPLAGNTFFAESDKSLTFVRWLSGILRTAECMYGPRDLSYTILGIEIDRTTHVLRMPCKHLIVRLSRIALSNALEAYYLMAHETVHLLAPSPEPAKAIEEGVAETFADRLVEWQAGKRGYPRRRSRDRAYRDADDAARELEARFGQRVIKQLRAIESHWNDLRPEHFESIGISDASLIRRLLKPMPALDNVEDRGASESLSA